MKYFTTSYIFTLLGLIGAWFWAEHISQGTGFSSLFVVLVLVVLEVSLSFDNAVINASRLQKMSPKWQKRFLTWGILIAVFGMRFLFPIIIVSIFARISFFDVINLALYDMDKYAHYLHVSHPPIITFGGSFLILLFFSYFFNPKKKVHWIKAIEEKFSNLGKFKGIGIFVTLFLIYLVQHFANEAHSEKIIIAGISGICAYLFVEGLIYILERYKDKASSSLDNTSGVSLKNSCFVNFLYLELIDSSFSLDGVLGAFALSKDIVIITIGLSIGAIFVRSLTIMLVEKKTLKEYKYIENGAYYAIGALSIIMLISAVKEVPEIITLVISIVILLLAFISSLKVKKD